jgi:hypothetical protein
MEMHASSSTVYEDEQMHLERALHLSRLEADSRREEERKLNEILVASMQIQRAISQDNTIYREELDVTKVFDLLTEYSGENLRLLGLDWGVRLRLKQPDGTPINPMGLGAGKYCRQSVQ